MKPPARIALAVLGIGALVAGGVVIAMVAALVAMLLGPLVVWLAWNVLDLAHATGLPELGFWAIVLVTLFLAGGWLVKAAITGIVFLVDPGWLHGAAQAVHWPAPTFRNFVAIALLALLASRPHVRAQRGGKAKRAAAPPA